MLAIAVPMHSAIGVSVGIKNQQEKLSRNDR